MTGNPDGSDNPLPPGFVNSDEVMYLFSEAAGDTKTFTELKAELDKKEIKEIYTKPKPAYMIRVDPINWVPNFPPGNYDAVDPDPPEAVAEFFGPLNSSYILGGANLLIDEAKVFSSSSVSTAINVTDHQTRVDGTGYDASKCPSPDALTLVDSSLRFSELNPPGITGTEILDYGEITDTETLSGHEFIANGEYYSFIAQVRLRLADDSQSGNGFCPSLQLAYIVDDGSVDNAILENRLTIGPQQLYVKNFAIKLHFPVSSFKGKSIRLRWELSFSDTSQNQSTLLIHTTSSVYQFSANLDDRPVNQRRDCV